MDTTTDIDPVELESKGNVLEFAKRYANLLIEQKKIKEDMKALCQEYEELGVPTKIAIKAINEQKKLKKRGSHEIEEIQLFMEWMASSQELDDCICELVAK